MTTIAPIFTSIDAAAVALDTTPWTFYKLCYSGEIKSDCQGPHRKVFVDSLRAYIDALPTEAAAR